ncbi:c-type cytochrome [Botrimarina mediterranea]|uniref:Cytochrome c n=2 Tax=Botrimarina mediterranea TaxID=2528022 RepID=A0A518K347_9BACT|nr:c-type cytochrome [Botrimarina mediterranea]QDV72190.1 Cytochrome c [Botrimarina mediterranea]QDV76733.1 Cytochrome c [Planctomycetes bacterium K2D]
MRRQTFHNAALLAPILAVAFVSALGAEVPSSEPSRQLPPGPLGEAVELGRRLVNETSDHPLSAPFVGNDLNCTSCHLDDGEHPTAGSFLGVATAYPAWSPRENRVITLEDRVLNCFMRSENGIRPPNGSEVSVAISAYITWLSQGESIAMNPDQPLGPNAVEPVRLDPATADVDRGADLYETHCAACHREDGLGSDDGPPVWGDRSYNRGAGLSQNVKLASWLKVAMPLGEPILTEQEALDIAAYVNSQERPEFVLEEHLGTQKPHAAP